MLKYFKLLTIATCVITISCNAPKMYVSIPEQFKASAQLIHVNGLRNEWRNKPLEFGVYSTSRIKRGWKITYSKYDRNSDVSSLERVLKAFKIDRASFLETEKDRFCFTIKDTNTFAEVFTKEERVSEITRIGSRDNYGNAHFNQKGFQYSFSAIILPISVSNPAPWKLSLFSQYEQKQRKNLLDIPTIPEVGILTNENDTISIKMIRINKFYNERNETVQMPFGIASIYEMRIGNEVCAILDTWGRNIWLYQNLDQHLKLIISASSTAIMLRRIN